MSNTVVPPSPTGVGMISPAVPFVAPDLSLSPISFRFLFELWRTLGEGDDLVSITDFGAAGDGTTDDTAAINRMINAVAAGTSVYWPNGTYVVSSTITVGKDMSWVGAGRRAATVAFNQPAANMFVFNACVNITDMGFTCSVAATSGNLLTYNSGATRFRLKNFWMTGFFSGIVINGASDIILSDGQMFDWSSGGTAILYIGGLAALFDGLVIQQTTAPGNGNGIVIENNGVIITSCEIMACGNCLVLAPNSGQSVDSMWVMNTGFDSAINGVLIEPQGSGGVLRNWFVGCWMSGMTQHGVQMTASGGVGAISGTDFVNCHVLGNGQHGFTMTDANSIETSWNGCNIAGNGDDGINMQVGAQNFSIIGCHIGPYAAYGNNGTGGVNLGGGCSYYRIVDNDLRNGGINPLSGGGVQTGSNPGVNEFISGNIGYVSQNRGQATIPSSTTFVNVSHGLSGTPRLQDISVTCLTGMGNPPQAVPFVLNPNSATFQIETGISLAFNTGYAWSAKLPCSI